MRNIIKQVVNPEYPQKHLHKRFTFHSDAGHGWLAVKRKLLEELGILDKVSSFSYQNGQSVYLEEDCDASLLLDALKGSKYSYTVYDSNSYVDHSHIRNYQSFSA